MYLTGGTITLDFTTIVTILSFIIAVASICGIAYTFFKWIAKQEKQDEDIVSIKEEQRVIVGGILACLKGLQEQGCNGPVTRAISDVEEHINKNAHK